MMTGKEVPRDLTAEEKKSILDSFDIELPKSGGGRKKSSGKSGKKKR